MEVFMPKGWKRSESWRREGKDFMVEVYHYVSPPPWGLVEPHNAFWDEGPNRWNVYAYIYPAHPHFAAFDGPHMWQDASNLLHFHGGPSYLARPMYEGKVSCIKVGSDYNHLNDDYYSHLSTAQEASSVFEDANELFEQLKRIGTGEIT
jgi:hypothetical protein